MRSFTIFFVFGYLVCLAISTANAQHYSSSSKPFFANPLAEAQQQPSSSPRPNIISRVVNWLRRPTTASPMTEPIAESSNDSNDQLPKDPTDRMINDAISDRILEESREQQSISGSPFINDNRMVDYESSATEVKPQIVEPTNDRTGLGRSTPTDQPNQPNDKIPLTEALRIVNTAKLTDCVARVICELSCNANAYGPQGRIVFRNMIKLQFDQSINGDDAKFFRQAATKGRQLVQNKSPCNECYKMYPACYSSSKDLVAVSSMFKL